MLLLEKLQSMATTDAAIRALLTTTEQIYWESVTLLKTVPLYMRQYTLHDRIHADRVTDLMRRLLPDATFERLQPLEISALILAAALHDIGMVASRDEIAKLRGEGASAVEQPTRYQAFRDAYPRVLRRMHQLRQSGQHMDADELEDYLTSEFIRRDHGDRSRRYIFDKLASRLKYDDYPFAARLAEVCASHTKSHESLEALPCWELVRAGGERCNWRFVALLLRLADILDFDAKRAPRVLFEHLGVRDNISVREWGKHLAINAWDIAPGRIVFSAACPDPVIHKAIYDFTDLIDYELLEAPATLARMHTDEGFDVCAAYELNLPRRVHRDQIRPEQDKDGPIYTYLDLDFRLSRDRIISLVLGVHLYAERFLFLRELLQNAVDACRLRKALHDKDQSLGRYSPEVSVRLHADGDHGTIEVEDNGVGMDENMVKRYFAHVGRSYYTSTEYHELRTRERLSFQPISQFGIGVLATFMAGDNLQIETLHLQRKAQPLSIEIADEGALFWFRRAAARKIGSKVSVKLTRPVSELFPSRHARGRDVQPSDFERLLEIVQDTVPHVEFSVSVEADGASGLTSSEWSPSTFDTGRGVARATNIDLTEAAPDGLNGIARVFTLLSPGTRKLVAETRDADDDRDRRISYKHQAGCIEAHITTILRSGDEEFGFRPEIETRGFLSQQGIRVPATPFPTHAAWGRQRSPVSIPFPLPVQYDLDVSGDYCLQLSADRKSILPSRESRETGQEIAREITRAFLSKLGATTVRRNRAFFRQMFSEDDDAGLVKTLDDCLQG